MTKILNSKSEARNKSQIKMFKYFKFRTFDHYLEIRN